MAVKKSDIQKLTENEQALVDQLEAAIDKNLKLTYLAGQTKRYTLRTIQIADPLVRRQELNGRVISTLVQRYRDQDWAANYVGDELVLS